MKNFNNIWSKITIIYYNIKNREVGISGVPEKAPKADFNNLADSSKISSDSLANKGNDPPQITFAVLLVTMGVSAFVSVGGTSGVDVGPSTSSKSASNSKSFFDSVNSPKSSCSFSCLFSSTV